MFRKVMTVAAIAAVLGSQAMAESAPQVGCGVSGDVISARHCMLNMRIADARVGGPITDISKGSFLTEAEMLSLETRGQMAEMADERVALGAVSSDNGALIGIGLLLLLFGLAGGGSSGSSAENESPSF